MAKRVARLLALLPYWASTAWWGLVSSRTRPVVVVDGAVLRDGEGGERELLLVVRPDVRGWELPGGHPDPGETHEEAVRREVREETGLEVEVGEATGCYRRTGFLPHTQVVHLCRVRGGTLRAGPESPKVRWWPAGALPRTLLPWCRQPITDALAHAPGAPARERSDRNGLARVLRSAGIDLRMRLSDDNAR